MPDEVVNNEEVDGMTINLMSPEMNETVSLSLTLGEVMLIRNILDTNINPRGYQMVEYCYNLMTKFKNAIESQGVTDEPTQEVFVSEENECGNRRKATEDNCNCT